MRAPQATGSKDFADFEKARETCDAAGRLPKALAEIKSRVKPLWAMWEKKKGSDTQ